jgi:hypothetical protein
MMMPASWFAFALWVAVGINVIWVRDPLTGVVLGMFAGSFTVLAIPEWRQ